MQINQQRLSKHRVQT